MKLLLDQGLPRTASARLRLGGVDAVHTAEIGMATALDEEILARAVAEERVVVTFDSDFHALLALSRLHTPSVVRIRVEPLDATAAVELIEAVLAHCTEDLVAGAAVTVQEKRIRVRRLPLPGS